MNPEPLQNDMIGALAALGEISPDASPHTAVPVTRITRGHFDSLPPSGLRVTWLGHSTSLVEIDGARIIRGAINGPETTRARYRALVS